MKRLISSLCVLALMVGPTAAVKGASVNIDFEGRTKIGTTDTTHVGADGIYSTTGTLWTSVPPNVDVANLRNEFGAPTDADVIFVGSPSNTFGFTDPLSTNDLQDSGIQTVGLQIVGLSPTRTYDIAGYIQKSGGFSVTDATGFLGFTGFGDPTYSLPGIETIRFGQRGDYILFSNLVPADLGIGNFGFTINTDGAITGLQILNVEAVPEPTTCSLALVALCLAMSRRRAF